MENKDIRKKSTWESHAGADEVAQKMNVSKQEAYRLIREWNEVLEKCGCPVKKGRVDRTFFLYKLHGDVVRDCQRIDFVTCLANSDGEGLPGTEQTVTVLFNQKVISETEVKQLIRAGRHEYDSRVIITTPEAADSFCMGKKPRKGGVV